MRNSFIGSRTSEQVRISGAFATGLAVKAFRQQLKSKIVLALYRRKSLSTAASHRWTSQERVNDPRGPEGGVASL